MHRSAFRKICISRHVVNSCYLVHWPGSICPLPSVTPSSQIGLRIYSGHHGAPTIIYQAVCKLIQNLKPITIKPLKEKWGAGRSLRQMEVNDGHIHTKPVFAERPVRHSFRKDYIPKRCVLQSLKLSLLKVENSF